MRQNEYWTELTSWSLFPLIEGRKDPAVKWGAYRDNPANTAQRVEWQRKFSNIGIVTGTPSGIVMVDFDNDAAYLSCQTRGLPTTVTVKTPRGYHLYFRHPGFMVPNSQSELAPGVDVRGDGGFAVGPGSRYVPTREEVDAGKVTGTYDFIGDWRPGVTELADLPEWIVEQVTPRPVVVREYVDRGEYRAPSSAYAAAALEREIENVRFALTGQRNAALYSAAKSLGQLVAADVLERKTVVDELSYASPLDASETKDTIESGLNNGRKKPRTVPVKPAMSAAMARKLLRSSK